MLSVYKWPTLKSQLLSSHFPFFHRGQKKYHNISTFINNVLCLRYINCFYTWKTYREKDKKCFRKEFGARIIFFQRILDKFVVVRVLQFTGVIYKTKSGEKNLKIILTRIQIKICLCKTIWLVKNVQLMYEYQPLNPQYIYLKSTQS